MPAIGMGLLWGGYTLILWGYCQVRGYDVSLGQLVIPGKFKGTWPPPLYDDGGTSSGMGKVTHTSATGSSTPAHATTKSGTGGVMQV